MSARPSAAETFGRRLELLSTLAHHPRGILRNELLELVGYPPGETGRRLMHRDRVVLEGAGIRLEVWRSAPRAMAHWRLASSLSGGFKRFTRAA